MFEIPNNTIEACSICEQNHPHMKVQPIHACEGCKHRLFTHPDYPDLEFAAPFHVDVFNDFVVHTHQSCPLINQYRKIDWSGQDNSFLRDVPPVHWDLEEEQIMNAIAKNLHQFLVGRLDLAHGTPGS